MEEQNLGPIPPHLWHQQMLDWGYEGRQGVNSYRKRAGSHHVYIQQLADGEAPTWKVRRYPPPPAPSLPRLPTLTPTPKFGSPLAAHVWAMVEGWVT